MFTTNLPARYSGILGHVVVNRERTNSRGKSCAYELASKLLFDCFIIDISLEKVTHTYPPPIQYTLYTGLDLVVSYAGHGLRKIMPWTMQT